MASGALGDGAGRSKATSVEEKGEEGRLGVAGGEFECRLLSVPSRDGRDVRIPATMVYSKASPPSAQSPLVMQVYGAYGLNLEPQFEISAFPLLRRGWCQVLVHARGG